MITQNPSQPDSSLPDSITTGLKRVVVASMAGTVVEWYEFFLYASAATLVFNHILFPQSDNPLDAVLLAKPEEVWSWWRSDSRSPFTASSTSARASTPCFPSRG